MIEKAHAKVNIFLKIVGTRGNYHELLSRFVRVENLYDTLRFEKKDKITEHFELEGDFGCTLEKNSIYKAFSLLTKADTDPKIQKFFNEYKVVVDKQIPEFAGLGGGSSDAAAFLRLINSTLSLKLSEDTLLGIASEIGADVAFFLYNYPAANVAGIGEIVGYVDDAPLHIETFTPDIACDTAKVYGQFRAHYFDKIDSSKALPLLMEDSSTILQEYDALFLNDLFDPALDIYPNLKAYYDNNFFSGSGSSFFRVNNG